MKKKNINDIITRISIFIILSATLLAGEVMEALDPIKFIFVYTILFGIMGIVLWISRNYELFNR